jgi:Bacterial Ig-like domain (group 3)
MFPRSSKAARSAGKVQTSMTLVTSRSSCAAGEFVTFAVTITTVGRTVPDGEIVTFKDGIQTLGMAALTGGKAAFTTRFDLEEAHPISALYAGNSCLLGTTESITQVVHSAAVASASAAAPAPSPHPLRNGGIVSRHACEQSRKLHDLAESGNEAAPVVMLWRRPWPGVGVREPFFTEPTSDASLK